MTTTVAPTVQERREWREEAELALAGEVEPCAATWVLRALRLAAAPSTEAAQLLAENEALAQDRDSAYEVINALSSYPVVTLEVEPKDKEGFAKVTVSGPQLPELPPEYRRNSIRAITASLAKVLPHVVMQLGLVGEVTIRLDRKEASHA